MSMGIACADHFAIGQPLDAVVYDATTPLMETTSMRNWMSTLVFAPGAGEVFGTLRNGKWLVRDGRHIHYAEIKRKFVQALKGISNR